MIELQVNFLIEDYNKMFHNDKDLDKYDDPSGLFFRNVRNGLR